MINDIAPVMVLSLFGMVLFFVFLWPPIAAYRGYRYLYESGTNDREKAKEIVKNEIDKELGQKYLLIAGRSVPTVLYDILENKKYKDKLDNVDIEIVLGKELQYEKEEEKNAFISFLKGKNIKCYMMNDTPPHHFRICDDRYVYVEKKHGDVENRDFDIYRNGTIVSKYLSVFEDVREMIETRRKPDNKEIDIADIKWSRKTARA
jgi:hypothetical protein